MEESMNFHKHTQHTRPSHDRVPARRPSQEEATALRRLVIAWRDEWRLDVATRQSDGGLAEGRLNTASTKSPKDSAKFAAAMARQEFGRFYWNGKLAAELASTPKPRPVSRKAQKPGRPRS
jgi:hypothetical protein